MVPFGRSEFVIMTSRFESEVGENLVEVIAAKIRNPVGSLDRVIGFSQSHERNIEGAATHVIYQQPAANAAAVLGAVAPGILDGRSRRLVHQPQHGETRALRRFLGEKTLIAVGIGRNAQNRFKWFVGLHAEIRMLQQLGPQCGHHLRQQKPQGQRLATSMKLGVQAGAAQAALQRPQDRPAVVLLRRNRLPSVEARVAFDRYNGRKPVARLAVRLFEIHQGEVAAIDRSDNYARRSEVDTNSH